MPLPQHVSMQIAGWIFVAAGGANVAASILSRSALFAVAAGCMFIAATFFFVVAIKLGGQRRKGPRD